MAAAAATGMLSMPGASASALTGDQEQPSGSAGVLSGNSVEVPVAVPVNLCGDTIDVLAAANPASGNDCAGEADATAVASSGGDEADETSGYDEEEADHGTQSGGFLSGNSVQAPVSIGLNLCGDTVDVVGAANPATGNSCASSAESVAISAPPTGELPPAETVTPPTPPTTRGLPQPVQVSVPKPTVRQEGLPTYETPVAPPAPAAPPVAHDQLADTGVDQNLLAAAATSAGLLVGGGILYRRARAAGR
ncbi:chaplin [Streptomyces sp. Q6]|uniref:Chaplin n=1 Tax=Streptomyces citrinus TaxID=3118173 RepID=A0ACD5ADF5_9ACTN